MARTKVAPGNADAPAEKENPEREGFERREDIGLTFKRVIKVTWGEEVHQPVQYNGFRIGGIELQVEVPPGKTIEEVYEETWDRLEALGQKQYQRKLTGFVERLQTAGQTVRAHAASKKG